MVMVGAGRPEAAPDQRGLVRERRVLADLVDDVSGQLAVLVHFEHHAYWGRRQKERMKLVS